MMGEQEQKQERRERYSVLREIEDWVEMPMFILSLLWVALLAIDLVQGSGAWLETAITAIWIVFVVEFSLKFVIAPDRLRFLRKNWLSGLALLLPALRVFRVARVFQVLRYGRAVRGLTLARVLTAFNRGLTSLKHNMGRFGFGYVMVLTVLVILLGTAGFYTFERPPEGRITSLGDSLWFTAMLVATTGSEYWPRTPEGRVLCFLIALYAFGIFGYITATLATLLVGQEQKSVNRSTVSPDAIEALRVEIAALREQLREQRAE